MPRPASVASANDIIVSTRRTERAAAACAVSQRIVVKRPQRCCSVSTGQLATSRSCHRRASSGPRTHRSDLAERDVDLRWLGESPMRMAASTSSLPTLRASGETSSDTRMSGASSPSRRTTGSTMGPSSMSAVARRSSPTACCAPRPSACALTSRRSISQARSAVGDRGRWAARAAQSHIQAPPLCLEPLHVAPDGRIVEVQRTCRALQVALVSRPAPGAGRSSPCRQLASE